MSAALINEFEVDYARFNARKTVATVAPSQFEHVRMGSLEVTRDAARSDSYYNRIVGLTPDSVADVAAAIAWIAADTGDGIGDDRSIRVDVSNADIAVETTLKDLGFQLTEALVWMHAPPFVSEAADGVQVESRRVHPLTSTDWPLIRRLLEDESPIADDVWQQKRNYLCTTTFRWFGIFDNDELVSAASIWIGGSIGILGSAYTLPDHRGRGHQRSLLDARRRLTLEPLFVDVAPQSTSYRNCLRAGFNDVEHRQVWERPSPI